MLKRLDLIGISSMIFLSGIVNCRGNGDLRDVSIFGWSDANCVDVCQNGETGVKVRESVEAV